VVTVSLQEFESVSATRSSKVSLCYLKQGLTFHLPLNPRTSSVALPGNGLQMNSFVRNCLYCVLLARMMGSDGEAYRLRCSSAIER
jgi:hypothetical protein